MAGGALLATSMLRQPQEGVQLPCGWTETKDRFRTPSCDPEPEPEPAETKRQLLPLALQMAARKSCEEAKNEEEVVEKLIVVMQDNGADLVAGPNWKRVQNRMDQGEGDLVFRLNGVDYVVEVKYIPTEHPGPANRTAKRKKVKQQALDYGKWWGHQHPGRHVVAVWFTNEKGWVELADCSQPQ